MYDKKSHHNMILRSKLHDFDAELTKLIKYRSQEDYVNIRKAVIEDIGIVLYSNFGAIIQNLYYNEKK